MAITVGVGVGAGVDVGGGVVDGDETDAGVGLGVISRDGDVIAAGDGELAVFASCWASSRTLNESGAGRWLVSLAKLVRLRP
jgi:predicted NBD/HSP70 family sugar kinase